MAKPAFIQKLHPRKKAGASIDQLKRTLRVGNYWYWLKPPELAQGIEIAALVCPLRYDVLLRLDFFSFYATHRELYRSDFDAFVDRASQTPYYVWYFESEAVRTVPHLLGDQGRLWDRFVGRIRSAAALYESMMERGFDRRFPITLRTAERLLPPTADRSKPPTGKTVSARYFQAVGCHRLAMLMYTGYTVLPADFFRVQCFREFSPFDSTSLLARSLPIPAPLYFRFLSSHYSAPLVFEDKDGFLAHLSAHKPWLLPEVRSAIQVDGFG